MSARKKIIGLVDGIVYKFSRTGIRQGIHTLEEANDYLAKTRCCGIDCCEGVLYLKNQTTGKPVKISIENDGQGNPVFVIANTEQEG
jgi:hypothetical protein